ncbi:MAG: zinc ribbon domain-containing protein [Deltaproteobacteria bacterium]|nr:zinc ribbon domain-containing protein [Deltaproteobacteria bacterium]MBW2070206.1 zinc ribbon domain-containing protein [Deltaproteobacteria bacterium]
MPIYEYRCCSCNECFETLVFKTDEPAPSCPHCGAEQVERLLSAFACTTSSTGSGTAAASGCSSSGFS